MYDFSGKVLSTYLHQKNPASGVSPQTRLLTTHKYDHAGRLTEVKKKLNDTGPERIISGMSYDELGQLKVKRIGSENGTAFLDSLQYEYNIRGWLAGINKAFVNTASSTASWFGQELSYDYGFTKAQFNGNISGAKWKSGTNGLARAYGYEYDRANRLIAADFNQKNTPASAVWEKNLVNFTVNHIGYDANGNILRMKQNGQKGTTPGVVDQLRYEYNSNGNQLRFVRDSTNDITSTLGDFKEPAANNTSNNAQPLTDFDYRYDGNGNMILDKNKEIAGIVYNHLNLPQQIHIAGKGLIQYTYDAAGQKWQKKVTDSTVLPVRITVTDYINGMVYEQDSLRFLAHEEGRVRVKYEAGSPLSYVFDYFERDHLGNVRLVLTEESSTQLYMASMETEQAPKENALFSNVDASRSAKPVGYPEDNTTAQNESVAKLNAVNPDKRMGPSIVLRVMAGDTISLGAKAFYKSGPAPENKNSAPPQDMLGALISAFGNGTGSTEPAHGGGATAINNTPFNNNFNDTYRRLKEKDPQEPNPQRPKAYLNFVLFDDQFTLVEDNSGVKQVQASPDELQTLAQDKMVMRRSGFLYVYTSNESQQDVYFDNVVVVSNPGPVVEETHYYPYGLTMAGISMKAMGKQENKFRYNGKELQSGELVDGFGLELYDYHARFYDMQTGRWLMIDPLADATGGWSPFAYAFNNPVRFLDPNGMSNADSRSLDEATQIDDIKFGRQRNYKASTSLKGPDDWVQNILTKDIYWDPNVNSASDVKDPNFKHIGKSGVYEAENGGTVQLEDGGGWHYITPPSSGTSDGVGQPGTLESMIPIWGSGRAAIDHFQNGNIVSGIGHSVLAASDLFLASSVIKGLAKGGLKMVGSHTVGATRSYYLKRGFAKPNTPLHHWMIHNNGKYGKHVPNVIKNQMWNYKVFSTQASHMIYGHGKNFMGQPGANLLGQLWYGTPNWPKLLILSYGGRGASAISEE
jgi:RHS repeat-associated protein